LKLKEKLIKINSCSEAVKWIGGRGLQKAWTECNRADWMLWLCGKMVDKPGWPTRQKLVLVACDCASRALKYVPDGEDRPRKAIETARAWTKGRATIEQVRDAAAAADAVYAADAAAAAAAADAVYAADAAAAAAAVVYADAAAAAAAAAYAADAAAAYVAARKKELKIMANMIRRKIKVPKTLVLGRCKDD